MQKDAFHPFKYEILKCEKENLIWIIKFVMLIKYTEQSKGAIWTFFDLFTHLTYFETCGEIVFSWPHWKLFPLSLSFINDISFVIMS